jgi:hypothetical protein
MDPMDREVPTLRHFEMLTKSESMCLPTAIWP